MFDNLRDYSDSPLYEDEQKDLYKEPEAASSSPSPAAPKMKKSKTSMGMNAQQRFIIASMFLFVVCLLGLLAMFVMGKMSLF